MKHVLVVAQDPDTIRLLKSDLTSRGFRVTLARSAQGATAAVSPTCAFWSIRTALADGDGIEVCRRLRRTGN